MPLLKWIEEVRCIIELRNLVLNAQICTFVCVRVVADLPVSTVKIERRSNMGHVLMQMSFYSSQTVRWRPSPIHFPIWIHTMHTYLKSSLCFRYDYTNNIELLQILIILEPVYEFIITSDVSTSAVGIFTPVFDLPFRILMPTYL